MMPRVRYKKRKETRRVILHDSHTFPDVEKVEEVGRWAALAREGAMKMGLIDTGYHLIIERNGAKVEGRPLLEIGTHTPGQNMDSIGVCLVGGRDLSIEGGVDNFTPEQWRSLFEEVARWERLFGELELRGHSEEQRYRNRSLPNCPPVEMDDVRQEYALFKFEQRMDDYERRAEAVRRSDTRLP